MSKIATVILEELAVAVFLDTRLKHHINPNTPTIIGEKEQAMDKARRIYDVTSNVLMTTLMRAPTEEEIDHFLAASRLNHGQLNLKMLRSQLEAKIRHAYASDDLANSPTAERDREYSLRQVNDLQLAFTQPVLPTHQVQVLRQRQSATAGRIQA